MSNLQAFILCCCVLIIETITLITFGFNYGKDYTIPTLLLFAGVDIIACVSAVELGVIEEKRR